MKKLLLTISAIFLISFFSFAAEAGKEMTVGGVFAPGSQEMGMFLEASQEVSKNIRVGGRLTSFNPKETSVGVFVAPTLVKDGSAVFLTGGLEISRQGGFQPTYGVGLAVKAPNNNSLFVVGEITHQQQRETISVGISYAY